MDLTVVVATFGEQVWVDLAQERAIPSAERQAPTIHVHGDSITESRNAGLAQVETEWIAFLDADDQLEDGYIEAMSRGTADVRGPMVRFVELDELREWQPRVVGHWHDCTADCLKEGNWLVIGSAVRANMLRDVGGFRDFAWCEDWDLWCRCYKAGATFELVRDAWYRAYVRPDSRNRGQDAAGVQASFNAIREANFA